MRVVETKGQKYLATKQMLKLTVNFDRNTMVARVKTSSALHFVKYFLITGLLSTQYSVVSRLWKRLRIIVSFMHR